MRIIALLLVVLLSFTMTACQKETPPDTSPEYKYATDYPYQNGVFSGSGHCFTETEDSFYYIDKNGYVHVIDKKSMLDTILCARPNCSHYQEGQNVAEAEQCIAYVTHNSLAEGFSYYEGNLYILTRLFQDPISEEIVFHLLRLSPDGTEREIVWDLEWSGDYAATPGSMFIHRGIAYFRLATYDEETQEFLGDKILTYNMQTKKHKIIYETENVLWKFYALGNHLYINWQDTEDIYNNNLIQFDLTSHEAVVLDDCRWVFPTEDQLIRYYRTVTMAEDGYTFSQRLTTVSLDGETETPLETEIFAETPETSQQILGNGTRLYVIDGFTVDKVTNPQEIRVYEISTGEQVAEIPMPEFTTGGSRLMWFAQDGRLLLYTTMATRISDDQKDIYENWTNQFFYCNISDIGTPDFQWYEVEKIN